MSRPPSLFIVLGLLVACASPDQTDRADPSSIDGEKLLDGEFSFAHRAVGKLELSGSLCTATLIRPNVILTAAHCVEYRERDRPGRRLGTFTIEHDDRTTFSFEVDATAHFATVEGKADPSDVAIARLSTAVDEEIARPADLARREPTRGFWASIVGYGCANDSRQRDDAVGRKQVYRFKFDPQDGSHVVCPGDSGGPTLDQAGRVFRVTSGWDRASDVFGDVLALREHVEARADAWTVDSAPVTPDAPPASAPSPAPTIHRATFEDDSAGGVIELEWSALPAVSRYTVRLTSFDLAGQEVARTESFEAGQAGPSGRLTHFVFGLDACFEIFRQADLSEGEFDVRVEIGGVDGDFALDWLAPRLTCVE